MNQNIDISISKLSAPVEALNIDPRACQGLRRAGICSVAEILLAGKLKVNSARHIGPLTTSRIFAALASYLGLPEDQLAGEDSPESGTLFTDPTDVWEAPISTLPLPALTLHALRNMGLRRIRELVKSRAGDYSKILGLGDGDIRELDQALSWYLARAAQYQLLPIAGADGSFDSLSPALRSKRHLVSIFPARGVDERAWSILELRAMHFVSLDAIGLQLGGVSKQRVFQIMRQSHEHLRRSLDLLSTFFDHFEEKSRVILTDLGNDPLELKTLVSYLNPDPARSSLIANEKEIERAILLLRTLIMYPSHWFSKQVEPRWPSLLLLSCLVEPILGRHEPVRRTLKERKKRARKANLYPKLVYEVLARTGQPMHWSDIAEQACGLGWPGPYPTKQLHAALIFHHELFARVGQGTYALVKWGSQTLGTYPAILASILRQENKPMSFSLIFERVSAVRPVKRSTLESILGDNPRFYRSIEHTYGLRGWLPAGDKEELPTCLIEDQTSFKRVERARAKGSHIEQIIAQDRLQEAVAS